MKKIGLFEGGLMPRSLLRSSTLALIVISMATTGCASVVEMQKKITNQMPEREESITNYQYYVSRNIVLTLNPEYSDTKYNASTVSGGIARTFRQSIQISKSTPGIVPETVATPYDIAEDGRLRIGVAFEADDEVRLWFIQDDTNPSSKFHFEYDDDAGTVVQYGEAYYDVSWEFQGERLGTRFKHWWINFTAGIVGFFNGTNVPGVDAEPPYLLIKMKTSDDIRGARGRKIQSAIPNSKK
ncbi:MAG: hypothetical protein LBI94_04730 [Treponema sp.]|jgi:hypothetical protein|nr:hypothetical protein [Treponema sp.]